eukprot:6624026-Pyramimonas_sp.AAC.2
MPTGSAMPSAKIPMRTAVMYWRLSATKMSRKITVHSATPSVCSQKSVYGRSSGRSIACEGPIGARYGYILPPLLRLVTVMGIFWEGQSPATVAHPRATYVICYIIA